MTASEADEFYGRSVHSGLVSGFFVPPAAHSACFMQDAGERDARIIDSLEAARMLFAPVLAKASDERLYIAHMSAEQRLIALRIRHASERHQVHFPVREIVADAIALRSTALILAHNHPSGDPTPSAADIESTRRLAQIARPLGFTVRDHLVFGGGRFVSFRQRGLL